MRVIADLHGGDLDDPVARTEFQEIKDKVLIEVSRIFGACIFKTDVHAIYAQRRTGEARSYAVMWRKYKRRVLLAMSSQAFAQLVCACHASSRLLRSHIHIVNRMALMVWLLSYGANLQPESISLAVISYYARARHPFLSCCFLLLMSDIYY